MFDTWSLLSVSLMGLCKGLHSLPLIFFLSKWCEDYYYISEEFILYKTTFDK